MLVNLRVNSLAFRLIAGASAWTAVALLVAGFILTSLYREAVERAFDERLSVYLKTLVGALASQPPGQINDPGNIGEQRFELIYSGWYWQISRANGPVLLASRSLSTDTLDVSQAARGATTADGIESLVMEGPEQQQLRVLQRSITFDPDHRYEVLVAGNGSELSEEVDAFRRSVVFTLAAFGLGLIASTAFQVRWGLSPLDQVRRGLAELRSGREQRFGGPFPAEIEPLARELNALIASNQEIIERARTHVGNLAHALKTPLSVIANEARANPGALGTKVDEQAELMRRQITHHLDRARIAARSGVIGAITEVEPVLARLVRAMRRIHGERQLVIECTVADGMRFRGEQQDLEEVVGNLVDNACKWANGTVHLDVKALPPAASGATRLVITVDDDGPGLDAAGIGEATRRGKRLDESKPGSGLGLSIVTDLVGLYGGAFQLDRSPLGGLHAEVELPSA